MEIDKHRKLIEGIKNPYNQQAWKEFDALYRKLIYNSAIYYGLNKFDADDFTQSVFIKLWESIPKFSYNHKRANFSSWLKKVIYNYAMDFHKKKNFEIKLLEDFQIHSPEQELEIRANLEWEKYHLNRVQKKLASHFKGKAIKVFDLCLEGRSPAEISTLLGIQEGTVYKLKRRVEKKVISEMKLKNKHT